MRRSHAYTRILDPWRSHENLYHDLQRNPKKNLQYHLPKTTRSSSPQNSKQANHSMPIFKAFLLGWGWPNKNNRRQLDELQRITGGNPETPEGLAALSRLADIHVKDNKSKVGQKLLAGWNSWVTFPCFCALVLRDVWRYLRKRGGCRETHHVLIYVSMKLGDQRQRLQYMQ